MKKKIAVLTFIVGVAATWALTNTKKAEAIPPYHIQFYGGDCTLCVPGSGQYMCNPKTFIPTCS